MDVTTTPPARQRPKVSEDTARFLIGLGAATRIIRARKKLTQADVTQRARLGRNFVSAIENSKANPSITQLGQLAEGLGLAGAAELITSAETAARSIQNATITATE